MVKQMCPPGAAVDLTACYRVVPESRATLPCVRPSGRLNDSLLCCAAPTLAGVWTDDLHGCFLEMC